MRVHACSGTSVLLPQGATSSERGSGTSVLLGLGAMLPGCTVVRLYYHERMNDFPTVQLYYLWAMGPRPKGGEER